MQNHTLVVNALAANGCGLPELRPEQLDEAAANPEVLHAVLRNGVVKVPPSAVPEMGSCASSGRAWRLWAARHSQGEAPATERPATASGARASRLQSRRFHRL